MFSERKGSNVFAAAASSTAKNGECLGVADIFFSDISAANHRYKKVVIDDVNSLINLPLFDILASSICLITFIYTKFEAYEHCCFVLNDFKRYDFGRTSSASSTVQAIL